MPPEQSLIEQVTAERGSIADTPVAGTLASSICDRIRSDIVSGRRKPGTRIRLEELRGEFRVSWSPIREAVSRLVAEGLILLEGQRGYRVAPVSKSEFDEVIRLRTLLESMALRGSIARGDDAWEAEVLAAHHRLSKLEDRRWTPADADEWEHWHCTYHRALIRASNAPVLLQFCEQLNEMTDRYRRLFLSTHQLDRDVAGEHSEIATATLARNAEKACRLLERHIQRTGSNILRAMQL